MMLFAWVYFVCSCVVMLPLVGLMVWRRVCLYRDSHTRQLAAMWSLTGSDPLAEVGVSLLVDYDTTERVESLLAIDYLRFEVVVVGDVAKSSALRGVIDRFAMIDMGSPVVEPHLQRSFRRLFRSRERRFRRLVVVDTIAPNSAERFDCAVAVRSYDWVLPLSQGVWLRGDALRVLVWRMVERGCVTVVVAPLLRSEGACGRTYELWSMMGWRACGVMLVDGDAASSLGGFGAFAEQRECAIARCVTELQRRGADVVEVCVAVGRNRSGVTPCWLAVTMWVLLCTGVLLMLWLRGEGLIVVTCGVVVVYGCGVGLAVLSRAFGGEVGSVSSLWSVLIVPLVCSLWRKRCG